jgi:hypothetical protein
MKTSALAKAKFGSKDISCTKYKKDPAFPVLVPKAYLLFAHFGMEAWPTITYTHGIKISSMRSTSWQKGQTD